MPEVFNCPRCDRKLRVPEELLGKSVKCPTCGETWTPTVAAAGGTAPRPAEAEGEIAAGESTLQRPPARGDDEGLGDQARPLRRPRGDYTPHRGVLILIFSIVGIVACPIFAPIAWIMGNHDMMEIRAGRIDPEGESLTNVGRIIGIVGTGLLVLSCVIYSCIGGVFVVGGMSGGFK
jgi:hypothetical protein